MPVTSAKAIARSYVRPISMDSPTLYHVDSRVFHCHILACLTSKPCLPTR